MKIKSNYLVVAGSIIWILVTIIIICLLNKFVCNTSIDKEIQSRIMEGQISEVEQRFKDMFSNSAVFEYAEDESIGLHYDYKDEANKIARGNLNYISKAEAFTNGQYYKMTLHECKDTKQSAETYETLISKYKSTKSEIDTIESYSKDTDSKEFKASFEDNGIELIDIVIIYDKYVLVGSIKSEYITDFDNMSDKVLFNIDTTK